MEFVLKTETSAIHTEVTQPGGLGLLMATQQAPLRSQQACFKGFLQFCSWGMNNVQTFPPASEIFEQDHFKPLKRKCEYMYAYACVQAREREKYKAHDEG